MIKSLKKDRVKACELAAACMAGKGDADPIMPRLWSLTVFFEQYITFGAAGTSKDFGPKKPAKLKVVKPRHGG